MKKKLIGIFVCMLMISTVLPVSGNLMVENTSMSLSSGNILFVGGSGPGNYTKIQDAIDNASDGDTVFVYNGTYNEYNVTIDRSISLMGENRNTTVIDGTYNGHVIIIDNTTYVNISGFTIRNAKYSKYYGSGIEIVKSSNIIISDNIIKDNNIGISLAYSDKNIIEDNTFYNNKESTIEGYFNNDNVITGNTIDHPIGSYPIHGINLGGSTGNNISDNTIKNCDSGVRFHRSDNNIVLNNVISSGYRGIDILDGSNNKVIGNNVSYMEYGGIEIREDSRDNIIYHNNFEYNYENAVDEGNNTWDDGEFGNYWSDYEEKYPDAKKLRKEGIWDTPYEISEGNNKDTRPLIKQWPDPVSKSVQNNENVWLHKLLDKLPILQMILETLNDFYDNMKGGI